MKAFLYYLQMTILSVFGVAVFVFFGSVSRIYFAEYYPEFYWWSLAFYIGAGIFGIWFVVYAFKSDKQRRRLKSKKYPPLPTGKPPSSSAITKHRAPSTNKKRNKK